MSDRLIAADASKVDPRDFWRVLNSERYFRRELEREIAAEFDAASDTDAKAKALLKGVALHLGLELDHFEKRIAA